MMNDDFFIRYEIDPQLMEPVNDSESSNSETLLERFQPKQGFNVHDEEYKFFAITDQLTTDPQEDKKEENNEKSDKNSEYNDENEKDKEASKIKFGDLNDIDAESVGSNVESIESSDSDNFET